MTLKEIARQANVSVSTVSRVINQKNTKAASPEVQERIWKIVRKSGYTPNATARSLKLGPKAQIQNTTPKSIACIYARRMDRKQRNYFLHKYRQWIWALYSGSELFVLI